MKTVNLPALGSKVRVVTRYKESYIYATSPWRDLVLEGQVVESNKWDPQNTFKLYTGNPEFPNSVVSLDYVHDIKYLEGSAGKALSSEIRSWSVRGSRGDIYTVAQQGTKWTCTCSGFQFRRQCRHIKQQQTNN